MRPCFSCGSPNICSHREMELVSWYIGRLEALRALRVKPKAVEPPDTPRKPPAKAPTGCNGQTPNHATIPLRHGTK